MQHIISVSEAEKDEDIQPAPRLSNRDSVVHSAIADEVQIVLGLGRTREEVMEAIARVGADAQKVVNYLLDPGYIYEILGIYTRARPSCFYV